MLQARVLLAALIALVLAVAGCGGDDEEDGVGIDEETSAQTQPAPTEPATTDTQESENSSDGDDCVESWNDNAHGELKTTSALAGVSSEDTLAGSYNGKPFEVEIDDATDESGTLEVEPGNCVVAQRVGSITRYVFVESGVGGGVVAWHGIPLRKHPLAKPSEDQLDDEVRVRVLGSGPEATLGAAPDSGPAPDSGTGD